MSNDSAQTENSTKPRKQIVLLVHGIRDDAPWAEKVKAILSRDDKYGKIDVVPIRYGYFNSLLFWFPAFTRRKPVNYVATQIRGAIATATKSGADVTLICHSFGTWIVSTILREDANLKFYRVIMCGAVVPTDFSWSHYAHRFDATEHRIVNECGHRDIWPTLAKCLSWGYGPSGVHGFGTTEVRNRFHDTTHSQYFQAEFVEEFWKPLIWEGRDKMSDWERDRPNTPWYVTFLELLPLRWGVLLIVLCLALLLPAYGALYWLAPKPSFQRAEELGMRFEPIRRTSQPFKMGATPQGVDADFDKNELAELPQHSVRLRSFYMSDAEVTAKQFLDLAGKLSTEKRNEIQQASSAEIYLGDDRPIKNITWLAAIQFCNALSVREGIQPFYTFDFTLDEPGIFAVVPDWNADGYRLPTEAEWEFACRGHAPEEVECAKGDENVRTFGKKMLAVGWFGWNSSQVKGDYDPTSEGKFNPADYRRFQNQDVRKKAANSHGLYDMHGNVWEWCWDRYDGSWYASRGSSIDNPKGPDENRSNEHREHALRGGSAENSPRYLRSTCRDTAESANTLFVGFRVVRNMPWWDLRD